MLDTAVDRVLQQPRLRLESVLDDACARHRYPRPTTTLLLHAAPAGRYPVSPLAVVSDPAVEWS